MRQGFDLVSIPDLEIRELGELQMGIQHVTLWLDREKEPRCSVCASPVVKHGTNEGTQFWESRYLHDMASLLEAVREFRLFTECVQEMPDEGMRARAEDLLRRFEV